MPVASDLVAQLVTALPDELRATTVPGEVSTPGAWVTLDTLRRVSVAGGWRVRCSVYLVTADADELRAIEQLATMLDTCYAAGVVADGDVEAVRVVLPSDPTPLPALRLPVNLT